MSLFTNPNHRSQIFHSCLSMAPKKSNPMEEPPAACSEEEEEETSSEEETSDEEEGEEEEEEGDPQEEPIKLSYPHLQQTQKQTAVKKPEIPPATPKSKISSSEESGSESESESECEETPKPIATKPMEETSKATKPRSKPAAKRANETEEVQKDWKRAKKKGADLDEEDQKKPVEDTKKQLFQRLWSEEDEIAVLKGMIEYSTKKEADPNQDMNAFHEYIKKSLHIDVSKSQLVDKIRRLKKKYKNSLEKGLKKGKDPEFTKPHEQKAYELSKKLWGSESTSGVIESVAKSNGKARKILNQRGNNKILIALKAELLDGAKEGDKMEVDNDKVGTWASVNVKEKDKVLFDKSLGVRGLEEFVINDGMDVIVGVKKKELGKRWKKLQIAQLELFVQRNELIKEQAELILDAMKSSGN